MEQITKLLQLDKVAQWDTLTTVVRLSLGTAVIYLLGIQHDLWMPSLLLALPLIYYPLVYPQKVYEKRYWLYLALFVLLNIIYDPFRPANHHYVLMYVCLLLYLVLSEQESGMRELRLQHNARYILIAIMFWAGFHKLISPDFMDGSSYSLMFIEGDFFKPFHGALPSFLAIFAENKELINQFSQSAPQLGDSIQLSSPIDHTLEWIKAFSYLVMAGELLVALIFLVVKSPLIKNAALMGLALGIFMSRLECGFLSIICILGFAQCPKEFPILRGIYVALIIFFLSLVSIHIAYI